MLPVPQSAPVTACAHPPGQSAPLSLARQPRPPAGRRHLRAGCRRPADWAPAPIPGPCRVGGCRVGGTHPPALHPRRPPSLGPLAPPRFVHRSPRVARPARRVEAAAVLGECGFGATGHSSGPPFAPPTATTPSGGVNAQARPGAVLSQYNCSYSDNTRGNRVSMVDTTCGPCKKIVPTACTASRGWLASLASRGQLAAAAPRVEPPRRTWDNRRSGQRWPAVRPAVRRRWNPWRWHPQKRPVLLPVVDSSGAYRRQHSCRRHPPPQTLRNGGGGSGTAGTRAAADTAARMPEGAHSPPLRRRMLARAPTATAEPFAGGAARGAAAGAVASVRSADMCAPTGVGGCLDSNIFCFCKDLQPMATWGGSA